ncbi:hypothetical protein [Micromonospora chersina]|uniref:hypothetical protein n=1 Tax=Micromonospora chersina TaxID=47854 RepID=UPI0033A7C2B6
MKILKARALSRWCYEENVHAYYSKAQQIIDPIPAVLDGREAAEYLEAQAAKLEASCRAQVGVYPSNWWLFYLRVISPVIFGCTSVSYTRYRGFAERASAYSERQWLAVPGTGHLSEPQAKRCIRLVITAAAAEDVRGKLNYVYLGAKLVPSTDRPFELVSSDAVDEAINSFDEQARLNDTHTGAARMGNPYLSDFNRGQAKYSQALMAISMPVLLLTQQKLAANPEAEVAQFVPYIYCADKELSSFPWSGGPSSGGMEARLLAAVMRVALADASIYKGLWRVLHEIGFVMKSADGLNDYLERVCSEANRWGSRMFPGDLPIADKRMALQMLTRTEGGRSGRYFGPALRTGSDYFCVDLLAATLRLEAAIASVTAGGGATSGYRGKSWEAVVQAAINKTSWQPFAAAKTLISKTLKIDGRAFTDVDAVACRGKSLMIVSCKSWQLSNRYDVGDFSAVQNKAKDALRAARKLYEDVMKMRAGDGINSFNFRAYSDISGVVCVSSPLLLSAEHRMELDRVAPDIPVLTLPELVGRLSGKVPKQIDLQKWAAYAAFSRQSSLFPGAPIDDSAD